MLVGQKHAWQIILKILNGLEILSEKLLLHMTYSLT